MKFKYNGVMEAVDHALNLEVEKGADIKLNGKKMQYNDSFKPGDVITTNNKELIERLKATGIYEQVGTVKKEGE